MKYGGRLADGGIATSGVCFYRLEAEDFTCSRRMILLK